ncbi:DUF447 family protein [Candidatus Bathyarchaeota archaeon]|nr:DUF447 family protein [Candidatus Bathyarchaeota archaeon]
MTGITDLGFAFGVIAETIVTTYNVNGQANAAPMGVTMENLQRLVLRIYASSQTYKNLKSKRCGVVNVTYDAELFYRTSFKETNPNGKLPQEWFEKAETVDAPRLQAAHAHIEVTVANIKQLDAERAEVLCDVKLVQAANVLPKAYCRALFATVEAIVHATRVEAFINHEDREKREQALKLLETIKECNDVVNRVAPNSRYSEIMADLNQRIDSWRAKGES